MSYAASAQKSPEDESRAHERRIQWIAAATLGCVMAGHVLLETASDILFLSNIDVERLPLVTIALAVLALAVSGAPARLSHRSILIGLQTIAALVTLALWFLAAASIEWSYYALPLWAGIVTSLIIVRFWLVLGELFTITQGKRFFAAIAMGGSIGALVGAVLESMSFLLRIKALLLAVALFYSAAALTRPGVTRRGLRPGPS